METQLNGGSLLAGSGLDAKIYFTEVGTMDMEKTGSCQIKVI